MTYSTQNEISESVGMRNRVAQAVAGENMTPDPDSWTFNFRRTWAAAPGWDAAWESYRVGNPGASDPGLVDSVITDAMILSQIQAMAPTIPNP